MGYGEGNSRGPSDMKTHLTREADGARPGSVCLLVLLAAWCGLTFEARAIVDANSPANTNAPADGAPWNSMGNVKGLSGIYLGAGWVLTAFHVGPGDVNFGGTLFPWDGASVRLTNADGSVTDMEMFHLRTLPPLPRMALATTTPATSAQVDMIGFGFIAGSAQTTIGPYTGFYWSAGQFKSWGNNLVASGGTSVINIGLGDLTVFKTVFNAPPSQTSDEAQGAGGDSGGGVFHKSGSTWQLAGMIDAIGTLDGQTNQTAVYGNETFSADIATYRIQIAAVIAATPPVLSIGRSGTNLMVCWPDSGVTYNLFANSNLFTTSWTMLNPSLTLTNGQFCAVLPRTNSVRFFRLKSQ